ncbi:hypothetical protein GTP38_08485 [Duganella sp. FT94W]|uniref:Uncharacterized protein n=1 Tax=Duganella lactea TaxID=2692173 RepID=A0ABW9V6G2_9BURK|nr:hypothetical protein [Duganella lactea]MYM34372.1 hypothetical protein [Duganella lactea]
MASNLQQRAKNHTFSDPGTGCLALARYEELRTYQWTFGFILLDRFDSLTNLSLSPAQADMLLRFGEQAWRSANGWPLLCMDCLELEEMMAGDAAAFRAAENAEALKP